MNTKHIQLHFGTSRYQTNVREDISNHINKQYTTIMSHFVSIFVLLFSIYHIYFQTIVNFFQLLKHEYNYMCTMVLGSNIHNVRFKIHSFTNLTIGDHGQHEQIGSVTLQSNVNSHISSMNINGGTSNTLNRHGGRNSIGHSSTSQLLNGHGSSIVSLHNGNNNNITITRIAVIIILIILILLIIIQIRIQVIIHQQ